MTEWLVCWFVRRARQPTMASFVRDVCIVLFNLTCAVVIAGLFIYTKANGTADEPGDHRLCLKCKQLDLKVQPHLASRLIRRWTGQTEYCCADHSEQLSALIDLALQKQSSTSEATLKTHGPEQSPRIFASAHRALGYRKPYNVFRGAKYPDFKPGPEADLVFIEKGKSGNFEHVQGVGVGDGYYVIQQPGSYYIYSALRFLLVGFQPCSTFPTQSWSHSVLRIRPAASEKHNLTLLETRYTCDPELHVESHTTYIAGIFELEVGDVIKAETSAYGVLNWSGKTNYLGLMLV